MPRPFQLLQSARRAAVACALALPLAAVLPGAAAEAQPTTQRVVQGKVVNKNDAAVKGAVVYLKDDHTLSVRSSFTGADGAYRFGQLASDTDYSLWAESNGKKSGVKNISSFDTRREFDIELKVK